MPIRRPHRYTRTYGRHPLQRSVSQLRRLFLPLLIGDGRGLDGADADGLIIQHLPPQQAFYDCLLFER